MLFTDILRSVPADWLVAVLSVLLPLAGNELGDSAGKVGAGLGRTTGWIHRAVLQKRGVTMIPGATYDKIDDAGLHLRVGERELVLEVDTVVLCTGQEPNRELYDALVAAGVAVQLIGGADIAAELDAKRAIKQGTEVAAAL